MNRITNYTTTGKYCKLINCLAWWRWMSPTATVVPFSNLLATIFLKKLKKHECGVTGVFYVVELYRESILGLCEPRTLFKGFNQNTIKKTRWLWDDGTGSAKMPNSLTCFTYLYLRNKNVPGFTSSGFRVHLCFSTTQWAFLFETAAKRAVIKRCRTECAQRYVFLWDQVEFNGPYSLTCFVYWISHFEQIVWYEWFSK